MAQQRRWWWSHSTPYSSSTISRSNELPSSTKTLSIDRIIIEAKRYSTWVDSGRVWELGWTTLSVRLPLGPSITSSRPTTNPEASGQPWAIESITRRDLPTFNTRARQGERQGSRAYPITARGCSHHPLPLKPPSANHLLRTYHHPSQNLTALPTTVSKANASVCFPFLGD